MQIEAAISYLVDDVNIFVKKMLQKTNTKKTFAEIFEQVSS